MLSSFEKLVPCESMIWPFSETHNCFQVHYSPTANMYVTASKDGSIKVWDGVSNKCVNTYEQAHDGEEVCSVMFSRNAKVLASLDHLHTRIFVASSSVNRVGEWC